MDAFSPVKGKCQFWREYPEEDDRYNTSIKFDNKRVRCSCWVDGDQWLVTNATIPADCPRKFECRYYISTS